MEGWRVEGMNEGIVGWIRENDGEWMVSGRQEGTRGVETLGLGSRLLLCDGCQVCPLWFLYSNLGEKSGWGEGCEN